MNDKEKELRRDLRKWRRYSTVALLMAATMLAYSIWSLGQDIHMVEFIAFVAACGVAMKFTFVVAREYQKTLKQFIKLKREEE